MRTYKRFRTVKELKVELKGRKGWRLDLSGYKLGWDNLRVTFKIETAGVPVEGYVLFNTVSGRFAGWLIDGRSISSSTTEYEDCRWFRELLTTFYTNG